jgi:hypothetical protein
MASERQQQHRQNQKQSKKHHSQQKNTLSQKFCRCIKHVRRTVKTSDKVTRGSSSSKEQAAIAICVRSVLGSRGKTLKKFKCGKNPRLKTQKLRSNNT